MAHAAAHIPMINQAAEWARKRRDVLALGLVGALIAALPLLFPLGIARDFANSLARAHILAERSTDPHLQANYLIEIFAAPHLAFDAFAYALSPFMSVYAAGALFMSLSMALTFGAGVALCRLAGHRGALWPALIALPVFSETLKWGFNDFHLSVALGLWLYWAWLRIGPERWENRAALVFFTLPFVFFAHMLGALMAGYLILAGEVWSAWRRRKGGAPAFAGLVQAVVALTPTGLLLLWILASGHGNGLTLTAYDNIASKLSLPVNAASFGSQPLAIAAMAALAMFYYAGWRGGWITLDARIAPALVAMAALCAFVPEYVRGFWGLDFRFVYVPLILLIAATRFTRNGWRKRADVLAPGLAALSLVGAAWTMAETHSVQSALRAAFASAEPGGAVLTAQRDDGVGPAPYVRWRRELGQAASFGALEAGQFNPLLFTPVSFVDPSDERAMLDAPFGEPVASAALIRDAAEPLEPPRFRYDYRHAYWRSWPENFDHVLWLRAPGADGAPDRFDDSPVPLKPIAEHERFILYKIERPGRPALRGRR